MQSLRASPAFFVAVLVTLGLVALFGLMVFLMVLQPGFMGMRHFSDYHHRTHDLTFAVLNGTAVAGLLVQLVAPPKNAAGQLMALVPFGGLTLAAVLTNASVVQIPWVAVGAFTLVSTMLHPAGRGLLSSFRISRFNWVLLGLVLVAAAPLVPFAAANLGLQRAMPNDHAALGHYGFAAAFTFTVIGVASLASLRPQGWWLPSWVAGFLMAFLGLVSLAFPDVDSSLPRVWAVAAIAWGAAFVTAGEFIRRGNQGNLVPTPLGSSGADTVGVGGDRTPRASTPLLVYAAGAIILALVALFVVMHLMGGGPGLHAPSGGAPGPGASVPPEAESVKQQYASYTVQRAASEGYVRDAFCLDAASLGAPAQRGAMGFHATNPSLLRGPIDANRPQALMFDANGIVLGVEYEVTTDAVRESPRLFGRTFTRMPAHPGVNAEHYALHYWFAENPSGPFDDFNPRGDLPYRDNSSS